MIGLNLPGIEVKFSAVVRLYIDCFNRRAHTMLVPCAILFPFFTSMSVFRIFGCSAFSGFWPGWVFGLLGFKLPFDDYRSYDMPG
eukprot:scaffold834_cov244-Pinguiococcus_pyrenoidosus.AAC.5